MSKIPKKWLKMAEIYEMFIPEHLECTTTDNDKQAMYRFETFGEGNLEANLFQLEPPFNGYLIGKRFMDITVAMWREDIPQGILYKYELEEHYPKWWLDRVIGDVQQGRHGKLT